MFVMFATIDYNSFDLDFLKVHNMHVHLFCCYCFFGISCYLTPFVELWNFFAIGCQNMLMSIFNTL